MKRDIRELSIEDIRRFCVEHGMKSYVSNQVYSWIWNNACSSFSDMSNLSKKNREIFIENFSINKIAEDYHEKSTDGTIKIKFKLFDGNFVEGVFGTEDTILYAAAFDANGGLFEPLFGPEDAIISDELNHASIIDGIRLCKAERHRYSHNDMASLEEKLKLTQHCRARIIVTDGVFSMDGTIAQLDNISSLAEKYNALIMTDECHSTGFMGDKGRGVHELKNVMGKIDIITGTLGKALGGASGGFTSGTQIWKKLLEEIDTKIFHARWDNFRRKEVIEILRQRSRPYLFSNTLAPSIVGASLKVFELLERDTSLIKKLHENTSYFRKNMKNLGFDIVDGTHPIVPIMLYDAVIAKEMSEKLLEMGIYVVGFYYPVVPKDKARIRVQLSAAHSIEELDRAINAFKDVVEKLNIIG